jgi:hypothetical protein
MVERFLFDRIDTESAGAPIGRQDDFIMLTPADEAKPPLSLLQLTEARAKVALNAAIVHPMLIFRGDH